MAEITYKEFYTILEEIRKDVVEIKIQTTKTNGRVSVCEKNIDLIHLKDKEQDKEIKRIVMKYVTIYAILTIIFFMLTKQFLPLLL